jgi:hypothetical protein
VQTFSEILTSHTRLQDRASHSRDLIGRVRTELSAISSCCRPDLCIYAAGSLARLETGRISDLDLFFIADRLDRKKEKSISHLDEIQAFSDLIRLNEKLQLQPFSGDGEYLKIHELDDVIAGTGSSKDDSENLFTTRLLLLLESQWLTGETVYKTAISKVLEMYFRDGRGRRDFRPLFLLNDVLRYWRTLCLNYERDRGQPGKPWWKRNLNLKFPRKLTVYSMVLLIVTTRMSSVPDFTALSEKTPLERLAHALDLMGDENLLTDFTRVLDDYEDFLAAKSHSEFEGDRSPPIDEFNAKAQRFDRFLHRAVASDKLDQNLVRYIVI